MLSIRRCWKDLRTGNPQGARQIPLVFRTGTLQDHRRAAGHEYSSSAIIKIKVDGKDEITAAEGDGPLHALDRALRKVLDTFYPDLSNVHLTDFKVRAYDGQEATAAKVRVLLQSTDDAVWTTGSACRPISSRRAGWRWSIRSITNC